MYLYIDNAQFLHSFLVFFFLLYYDTGFPPLQNWNAIH